MKRPRTSVSDHAIVRYLERVQGYDILRLKAEIAQRVDAGARAGASAVIIEGFSYKLVEDAQGRPIVTTVEPHRVQGYCLSADEAKRRIKARARRVVE